MVQIKKPHDILINGDSGVSLWWKLGSLCSDYIIIHAYLWKLSIFIRLFGLEQVTSAASYEFSL